MTRLLGSAFLTRSGMGQGGAMLLVINSVGERAPREGGTKDLAFTAAIFMTMLMTGVFELLFPGEG